MSYNEIFLHKKLKEHIYEAIAVKSSGTRGPTVLLWRLAGDFKMVPATPLQVTCPVLDGRGTIEGGDEEGRGAAKFAPEMCFHSQQCRE